MALNVTVNGEARTLSGPMSVRAMLLVLGLEPKKIAVERNLEIVPRSTYDEVQVAEGDKYEIVHFIGGGSASGTPTKMDQPMDKPFTIAGKTYKSRLII